MGQIVPRASPWQAGWDGKFKGNRHFWGKRRI